MPKEKRKAKEGAQTDGVRTEADKSATAKDRGSKGGKKGRKARAEKLVGTQKSKMRKQGADQRSRGRQGGHGKR